MEETKLGSEIKEKEDMDTCPRSQRLKPAILIAELSK